MQTRREFIKTSLIGTGGLMLGGLTLDSKIYARSRGANDKVESSDSLTVAAAH